MRQLYNYLVSIWYLRPLQIWKQLTRLARRKGLHRFSTYRLHYLRRATGLEPFEPVHFPEIERQAQDALNLHDLSEIKDHTFTFLNRRVELAEPITWLPKSETQLWKYYLHYFDYAVALGWDYAYYKKEGAYEVFRELVADWIRTCPVATPIAWDAYPVSLRLSNWIKAYILFLPALQDDEAFAGELRRSLYIQACFLEKHLEYHILGNHLIENGRALLLSGLFFQDRSSLRWQKTGVRILWHELKEQFLEDGGHFERSPMYHRIMINLYQEVISVLKVKGRDVPPEVTQRLWSMQKWLQDMVHPDGRIALVNDSALDATSPQTTPGNMPPPAEGLTALPDSGYFVFRGNGRAVQNGEQNFLLFDCGPLGPDYLPAHGHCDTLSYELSLAGQRFIVDSGIGDYYGDLEWRTYYRGTRAHNTVVVDQAEQSEIWGRFRVARRARPLEVHWEDQGRDLSFVCGSHSGYRRLKGSITHRRWICWVARRFWLVCDRITGRGRHHVESLIHFHPEVEIVERPDGVSPGEVRRGAVTMRIVPWGIQNISAYRGETDPIQGWMAPEFGLQCRNSVWGLCQEKELPIWQGYLLWPEQTDVAVSTATFNDRYCVNVQTSDISYEVIFGQHQVKMEKKP